jgi:hypothetical protein
MRTRKKEHLCQAADRRSLCVLISESDDEVGPHSPTGGNRRLSAAFSRDLVTQAQMKGTHRDVQIDQ